MRAAVNQEDNQEDNVAGDGDAGAQDSLNPPLPVAPPHTTASWQLAVALTCREEAMTQIVGMRTWRTQTPRQKVNQTPPTIANQKTWRMRGTGTSIKPRP